MYGTVARLQFKPGVEGQIMVLGDQFAQEQVPGWVAEYIYQLDSDPSVHYMVVIFESKEAYLANANSPEQHARYEQFRAMLASEPEWNDGAIVWQHPAPG